MRRSLIVVIAIVVLVIIGVLALPALLNVNKYKPRIQAELEKKLGRSVTLGDLHLRLFPFSIKVDGLTIGESPEFQSSHPFAKAGEVYATASLMSLLHGAPAVNELTLDHPQIELIRNAAGVWNFANVGGASGAPANQSGSQPSEFTLQNLKINDGQVAVTDLRTKQPRQVYNHIDLQLAGFAPGKQFDIDLTAHFPGPGKEILAFSGKAGPLGGANSDAVPVNGHVSVQEVSLAGLNSVAAGAIPPNTDAVLTGDANITSANQDLACKGNLKLANPVIQGAKLNYPIDADYDLTLNRKDDILQVRSGLVKVGPTAVNLSGEINSAVKPSVLNVRVITKNASITDLGKLAAAFGVAFNANDQIKGDISADLTAKGAMNAPQVQGTLSSNSLQAQEITLTNVHANCSMKNGIVELSPVTAGVFGGQENGVITVDTRPAHPLCSVKSKLSGVDTNALLSAISSAKDTLYGSLAADANLNFAVESSANLARTLNGMLMFNVTNGRLKNVNILDELSKVGKFLNSAPAHGTGGTALQKLSGTLNIKDGVATTNNLVASMNEGSLSGVGSLNLVNQAIDMRVSAVLANGVSKTVGGTGIGGFLNTALANNKGELVLPVLVTGTMAHPNFAPDVQGIAKMKMSHLLPTTGDPTKLTQGAIGSVLGGLLGQSGQQPANQPARGKAQQQPAQQENPINSVLKQFGHKKK